MQVSPPVVVVSYMRDTQVPVQAAYIFHTDWIASAVQLQLQIYDDKFEIHGPYRGKPRPELEAAWANYVRRKSTMFYLLALHL
jgi:hypothetical protein